ncbi:sterol desaturase family protein [Bradyrhizobium sp.]|uniref:sterol desaturase family protein n=1 Tax=Bradyrhizobium sp. TaxID=376 RepID=UPI0025C5B75B|nr:sterol desaturase family protein [Bradyrhizobium sp.]
MLHENATLLDFAARVYPGILQHDLLRYVIGAGGTFLVINVLLGRYVAGRKIRSQWPAPEQMAREILASLRTVLIFSLAGLSIAFAAQLDWLNLYMDPAARGWPYFALNVAVLIVAHDAWFYWTHRVMHQPRLYRWFHRLHHRSNNPSPWTSYSFDASEAVVNAIYLPLALMLMPTSILAAFVFTAHMMLRNAVGHCGYEVFPAGKDCRPLFDWLTTVTHHDLHHARAGTNFGLYFTFWDRLMGTEDPSYYAAFARASGNGKAARADYVG